MPLAGAAAVPGDRDAVGGGLLTIRTRRGGVRPVVTVADWERRRAAILEAFQSITGRLPGRERHCPLDVRVEEEVDLGDVVRRRITYQSEPGGRVPAYLMLPRRAREGALCPAALCLHQTHPAGQRVVVGLGDSPDDAYGVELARRGWVCLAPPYPLLAEYHPDVLAMGYASGTMKAIWDNRRGLDLLESLSCVRRGAMAAIGHSLGGHNAIFTAVMDRRIAAVATSCAFDSFSDYMRGDLTGWTQVRYMPRLRAYLGRPESVPFDFSDLLAALAPCALWVSAPRGDTNFRWDSVDRVVALARPVFRLYGADERLVVRHPEVGHRFPPAVRDEAYEFLERHLGVADG